jgi:hypothetical protein
MSLQFKDKHFIVTNRFFFWPNSNSPNIIGGYKVTMSYAKLSFCLETCNSPVIK